MAEQNNISLESKFDDNNRGINEIEFEHFIAEKFKTLDKTNVQIKNCKRCGSSAIANRDVTSGNCPFCGSREFLLSREKSQIMIPSGVLPFKVDKAAAVTSLNQWLKEKALMPNEFINYMKDGANLQKIYLPYWVLSCKVFTEYSGVMKDKKSLSGEWNDIFGTMNFELNNYLIRACESLPVEYYKKIRKWDLQEMIPFSKDIFSSVIIESFHTESEVGYLRAQQEIAPYISSRIRKNIGGIDQKITDRKLFYRDIEYDMVLMPAWLSAYKYKDRVYRIIINGQTGEAYGRCPQSQAKTQILIWSIIAALAIIFGSAILAKLY